MSSEPSSSRWLGRKLEGYLLTARVVTGMKAARAQLRLLCRTWEPIASMRRENSKWRTHEEPVLMRSEGTDGFVVAVKPGNAGGAKEPGDLAEGAGQPVMGGAGV